MGTQENSSSSTAAVSTLEALASVSQKISYEPDSSQALWQLMCALRKDLDIDRAGVFSYNPATQAMEHIAGVGRNGMAEFSGRSFPVEGVPHPLRQIARREIPYYFSRDATRDFPDFPWAEGVRSHVIIPIIAGDELMGALAVDNCFSGKPLSRSILEPLFLYAGLAALPLFAIYQKAERERIDAMRRGIHREVLFAVTSGKICLCDRDEISREWPAPRPELPILREYHIRDVREAAKHAGVDAGMDEERAADLGLCASEAATNALLHGRGGSAVVEHRGGQVRIRVADQGQGIDPDNLPRATLLKGWSSQASMGLGFTVINETADRIFLYTGADGTVIIIEMSAQSTSDYLSNFNPLLWEDEVFA
jgi:anti-sigma regulatory factor (Ser/Thr protein kinase)